MSYAKMRFRRRCFYGIREKGGLVSLALLNTWASHNHGPCRFVGFDLFGKANVLSTRGTRVLVLSRCDVSVSRGGCVRRKQRPKRRANTRESKGSKQHLAKRTTLLSVSDLPIARLSRVLSRLAQPVDPRGKWKSAKKEAGRVGFSFAVSVRVTDRP